jgi:hypothetical protein
VSTSAVLVVVFAAVALGLAAFSLFVSLGARRDALRALAGVRAVAARLPRKRAAPEQPVEERAVDLGPPPEEEDRRQRNDGPQGRHRPPEPAGRYSRLRASADAREAAGQPADDATSAIPVVRPDEDLATAEHPAPTSTYRRPPPPLPPPGAIGREP